MAVHAVGNEVAAALRFGIGALVLLAILTVRRFRSVIRALWPAGMSRRIRRQRAVFFARIMAPCADGTVIVPVLAR